LFCGEDERRESFGHDAIVRSRKPLATNLIETLNGGKEEGPW